MSFRQFLAAEPAITTEGEKELKRQADIFIKEINDCEEKQIDLESKIDDLKDEIQELQEQLTGTERLETQSYEARLSDNPELLKLTGKPIRDIYYTGDDAYGQEHDWSSKDDTTSKQHQLDELYSAVYQSALRNTRQNTKNDIDSLYDGFNSSVKAVRMIRCLKSAAKVSITDPVKFRPNSDPASGTDLQSKWIVQIKGPWIDATSGYFTSWQIDLNKFVRRSLKPFMENALEDKLIVPVGVPGHSVAVYFEYNKDDGIACYWVDPNGPVNPEGDDFSVSTSCVKALWKLACYHNDIIWKDHLLCNIQPQGGPTLDYIKTGGLCAAFTAMIMLLVAINPDHTLEQIHQYLKFRVNQWSTTEEKLTDIQDAVKLNTLVDLVKQELGYDASKSYELFLNSPDGTNPEYHSIVIQGIKRALKSGPEAAAKISKFRQLMVSVYGNSTVLNWMECHILMFMQFIDEWYDETQPFAFFKSNQKALDKGLETFTKEKATGKLKFDQKNALADFIKTKTDLKIFLESGDERKKYIQKCGKESYNKEAR